MKASKPNDRRHRLKAVRYARFGSAFGPQITSIPSEDMALSQSPTIQYDAEHFVESAGAVLIKVSTRQICLVYHQARGEWLLAKGRRNIGESRQAAALREAAEETGYLCHPFPLTMSTRAPPAVEVGHYPDEPRVHPEACEPFMVTCRQLEGGQDLKIIWWYVAAIDEHSERGDGEEKFDAQLFGFEGALERLTFETDRDVVRKAIKIFDGTHKP